MKSWKATLMLVTSMIAWGSLYPISKHLMVTINPLFTSFLRYSIGVLPMIPLFIRERRKHPIPIPGREFLAMALLGAVGITGFALTLFFGIDLSTASNAALLSNTQPIFAAVLAPLLIGETFDPRKLTGILIGLAGIVLVTTGGRFDIGFSGPALFGNIVLLGAALCMTLYNIFLKARIRKFGVIVTSFVTMGFGTILLFLFVLALNGFMADFSGTRPIDIVMIVYLGIGATALPYLMFNFALKEIDVVTASGFKFLIPVSGILLSFLFIGETLSLWGIAGTILVLISLLFVQHSSQKPPFR